MLLPYVQPLKNSHKNIRLYEVTVLFYDAIAEFVKRKRV